MTQADMADGAARAVVTAKAANRTAVAMLAEFIKRQRLDLALPQTAMAAMADRDAMNVVGLIGAVIRDVGYFQVLDDITITS
jgi:hypothetical protein